MTTVALLNPGAMGVTIGASAKAVGSAVLWASAGRGAATRNRAEASGFEERDDLAAVLAEAEVVLSVCPPHAALDLAGARFVDGGIIGPPARHPIRTVSPVNPPRW